jgi:hypothetical protein
MRKISFLAASLVCLIACGGSSDDTGGDVDSSTGGDTGSGGGDTGGGGDTSKTDTAKDTPGDSPTDTTKTDTTTDDTSTSDTSTTDTSTTDTTTIDTTVIDTAVLDTGTTDTVVVDTGGDTDFVCGDTSPATICHAGQVCTRTYVTGGACLACLGGTGCPTGRHCSGGCCVPDSISYTYACKPEPSSCGTTVTCSGTCGSTLCPVACGCESVGTDGVVTCHICAP